MEEGRALTETSEKWSAQLVLGLVPCKAGTQDQRMLYHLRGFDVGNGVGKMLSSGVEGRKHRDIRTNHCCSEQLLRG